ncbi:MAG: hypothetical protein ACLQMH_13960 [Solirubrobacteraceae bacterium]
MRQQHTNEAHHRSGDRRDDGHDAHHHNGHHPRLMGHGDVHANLIGV